MSEAKKHGSKSPWLWISGVVLLLAVWWGQQWIAGGADREPAAAPLNNAAAKHEALDREPISPEERAQQTVRSRESELAPQAGEDLRIRVLDAAGSAAEGTTIVVRRSPRGEELLTGVSDAEGELRFAAVREQISDAAASTLIEIVATGITPEPEAQMLDPELCFASITEYRLPPIGALVLTAKRIDGSDLVVGEAEVLPQLFVDGKRPRRYGESKQSLRAKFEEGRAKFTSIQAEVPLFFGAQDHRWSLFAAGEHPGIKAGEVTTFELRFDIDRPIYRGRVLDGGTGKPIAEEQFTHTWIVKKAQTSSSQSASLWTNKDGVFYGAPQSLRDAMSLELDLQNSRWGRQLRSVPILTEPGIHDAGDWQLREAGPRIAGMVRSADGNAVAGAQVFARVILESGAALDQVRFEYLVAQLYADPNGHFEWNAPPISDDPQLVAETPIELTAWSATERSVPIRVFSGRQDIELRLERTGGFVAEVIHSERVPFHLFAAEYRSADTSAHENDRDWTRIFASNAKEVGVHGLLAGLYDFRLRLNATSEHAFLVPDIRVRSGEITKDPRLQPLNTREHFQLFDFEILYPPECVPYGLKLSLNRTGLAEPLLIRGAMVSKTHAALLTPPGIYDATFEASGFEKLTLRQLATGCAVEMKPAYGVRLFVETAELPKLAGATLELVLRRRGDANRGGIVRAMEAGTGELLLALSCVGTYDLLWRWRWQEGDEAKLRPLGVGTPASIEVNAASKGTSIKIKPPD